MDHGARYSVQEKVNIVEAYVATKSVVQTHCQFLKEFPSRNTPTTLTKCLLDKLWETGSLQDNCGQPWSIKTDNRIVTVIQFLKQSARKSARRLYQETDFSRNSVMHMMHKDLHLFLYTLQIL